MTFYASRQNIEPIFRFVSLMVMIFFCLCLAVMAEQGIRPGQSAGFDGIIDRVSSFKLLNMTDLRLFSNTSAGFSAFFTLGVVFFCSFAIFALFIEFVFGLPLFALGVAFFCGFALFALTTTFLRGSALFALVEAFPPSFALFALGIAFLPSFALFALLITLLIRYDFSSHFRLLVRRLWSEPRAPPAGVFGSFYFKRY